MTPVEIMEAIRAIEPGTVTRAYEGKAGKCCCGCSGKYFEAEQKDAVLHILYLIKAYATEPTVTYEAGDYAWVDVGKKTYVVYFS